MDRIRKEVKKFLEFIENESTIYQNLGKMERQC
jgi:DNA-binding PadR family transcriptional regulator